MWKTPVGVVDDEGKGESPVTVVAPGGPIPAKTSGFVTQIDPVKEEVPTEITSPGEAASTATWIALAGPDETQVAGWPEATRAIPPRTGANPSITRSLRWCLTGRPSCLGAGDSSPADPPPRPDGRIGGSRLPHSPPPEDRPPRRGQGSLTTRGGTLGKRTESFPEKAPIVPFAPVTRSV